MSAISARAASRESAERLLSRTSSVDSSRAGSRDDRDEDDLDELPPAAWLSWSRCRLLVVIVLSLLLVAACVALIILLRAAIRLSSSSSSSNASVKTSNSTSFARELARRLNQSGTTLLTAEPGHFIPTATCASPKLWLLLYGQVRSFAYTRQNLLAMASQSSGACSYTVALASPTVCDADTAHPGLCLPFKHNEPLRRANDSLSVPLRWDGFVSSVDAVGTLLQETAAKFAHDGRFAYAVVRMPQDQPSASGAGGKLLGLRQRMKKLPLYWRHLVDVIESSGVPIMRKDALIIRTRFDVWFPDAFDLSPMPNLFAHAASSSRGGLALSQESSVAQGDLLLITSYSTYATHIARLIERTGTENKEEPGVDNGWAFGRHVRPTRPLCDIDEAANKPCALTIVEDYVLPFTRIVRDHTGGVYPPPKSIHKLGERVRIYCASEAGSPLARDPRFEVVKKEWLPPFLRSKEAVGPDAPWPAGC